MKQNEITLPPTSTYPLDTLHGQVLLILEKSDLKFYFISVNKMFVKLKLDVSNLFWEMQ